MIAEVTEPDPADLADEAVENDAAIEDEGTSADAGDD